ncbi:hypothetical protein BC834DRAFT_871267 [Gloeopeniophorella convolvens]|nr:hypothetical protein BC834DRAFT_871267 [Gloeopeniophorella convolvens]
MDLDAMALRAPRLRSTTRCYNCNEPGHLARDCRKPLRRPTSARPCSPTVAFNHFGGLIKNENPIVELLPADDDEVYGAEPCQGSPRSLELRLPEPSSAREDEESSDDSDWASSYDGMLAALLEDDLSNPLEVYLLNHQNHSRMMSLSRSFGNGKMAA